MEHVVPADAERSRLDRYASQVFLELPSKARARKAAKAGCLLVNGVAAESSRFVGPGDRLVFLGPTRRPPKPYPLDLALPYVDPHLAIAVKPAGLLTSGNRFKTLEAALVHHLPPPSLADALPWPRPVHRLDFRTGGLVVAARTATAQIELVRQFERRQIQKRYRAIVSGRLEGSGTLSEPIDGRSAETRWAVVSHSDSPRVGTLTTLDLWPLTGRTHQLRRHVAGLGHPILGDDDHTPADQPLLRGKGLFLWAVSLSLDHPITGEPLAVEIEEPSRFAGLRRRQQAAADRRG